MKLVESFTFILISRFKRVQCSFLAYFENTKRMRIGRGTCIDSFASLKGGKIERAFLSVGRTVRIRRNCYISATRGQININDDVLIAHNSWIAGHGVINIGKNTLIGPNVVIVSSNHDLNPKHYPAMDAPEIEGVINIGENCWVGANSTIVPDVTIGDGCIVAGGTVVTKDVPSNTLIAGNPAQVVKELNSPDTSSPYKLVN